MIKKRYKPQWVAKYEADLNTLREELGMDPFEDWERNRMPEGDVEDGLRDAVDILYADRTSADAVRFLRRSLEVANRIFAEDKLQSQLCTGGFPENRGRMLRAKIYAQSLLREPLDVKGLLQASSDYEAWCKDYKGKDWDSVGEAEYLAAVRLAVIAGDLERASKLLKTKRPFKWHKEEHGLLKRVVNAVFIEKQPLPLRDQALLEQFDEYFDRIRDPNLEPDIFIELDVLRLEIGAIRYKYFTDDRGDIDWNRIIEVVSQ